MSIDTNNFSFATFISINNGDFFGSGFRIVAKNFEYIITAKHVIFNQDKLLNEVWIKSRNYYGEKPKIQRLYFEKHKKGN